MHTQIFMTVSYQHTDLPITVYADSSHVIMVHTAVDHTQREISEPASFIFSFVESNITMDSCTFKSVGLSLEFAGNEGMYLMIQNSQLLKGTRLSLYPGSQHVTMQTSIVRLSMICWWTDERLIGLQTLRLANSVITLLNPIIATSKLLTWNSRISKGNASWNTSEENFRSEALERHIFSKSDCGRNLSLDLPDFCETKYASGLFEDLSNFYFALSLFCLTLLKAEQQ